MRIFAAPVAALLCALVTPLPALAAPGGERAFQVPGAGTLLVPVPEGWRDGVKPSKGDLPPAITFSAVSGERFSLQLTPLPVPAAKRTALLGREGLRAQVQRMANDVAPGSVEKSLEVVAIGGGREGFHFGATDRAPGPGGFPYLTQGAIALDDKTICIFTLLTDGPRSPAIPRALEVLRAARIDAAAGPEKVASIERRGESYRIALPAGRGALSFPAAGLVVEQQDDARPYYFLVDRKTGLDVSFSFEPARECATSRACRDAFSAKLKALYPGRRDWRDAQVGDVFVSENTDPGRAGIELDQHHVNAHLVVNGVWIDVHLSKVRYRETDRPLFVDFIRSMRPEPAR